MISLGPTLSVTVAPLVAATGWSIARVIKGLGEEGAAAVNLSAAQRGTRPRELDRRARKDLNATLGRAGVMLGGWDLFIPRDDWLDTSAVDRAATATIQAIELAADTGRVPVNLALPIAELPEDVAEALLAAADGHDVPLAVHAEDDLPALTAWLEGLGGSRVGAGLDTAAVLAGGGEPADAVLELGEKLRAVRVDDFARTGNAADAGRCPIGRGALDVLGFQGALATAESVRSVVLELRGLDDPLSGLRQGISVWSGR